MEIYYFVKLHNLSFNQLSINQTISGIRVNLEVLASRNVVCRNGNRTISLCDKGANMLTFTTCLG